MICNNNFSFTDVTRTNDDILYMAFYFPQFHISPENKIQLKTSNILYTDWDFLKQSDKSFTPHFYYNLGDVSVFDKQDDLANEYKIGVFIFYHYWLDNKMILNLPVDLFIQKKRKTKFIFCWDNQSGYLGKQNYNSPEEHAYQMVRFFINENYLTDKNGKKPFIIYLATEMDMDYLNKFINFLKLYNIDLKIGFHYQKYISEWTVPKNCELAVEFGPHSSTTNASSGSRCVSANFGKKNNFPDYWQGIITSWDSRPRANSSRTHQQKSLTSKPNGIVSVDDFKNQVKLTKNNIAENNKDKIITVFAWNEWSEGAVLEDSIEFGKQFLKCL
jgi:hypothetical protein